MGRMKEKFIDLINQQPDDIDWDAPPHIEMQPDGKKLWIIKEYKIWAYTYEQALQLLPMIESF